ncbi:hypothetical protein HF086_005968 [Spodoptera exigua]|uniref:trypsin n=1 Tax=Spodoptera exigua TaxID=7107 RepID=A0A922M6A4_SPOEX|nr:hypothetical protein HF086_005968 [Spodoptera exigua]
MRLPILFVLLGSALAVPRNPSRIVGGTETTVEEYPYMVNMQYSSSGMFFWNQRCGGSLLTSTAVLSAAHCFYEDSDWQWRVVLGTSFRNGVGGSVHTIQRVIMHPQYIHKILNNDVAIVRFSAPAVFSNTVQQARIPGTQYNLADGSLVTHVGWGRQWTNGPLSEQLLHVDVNVINQEVCAARYAYLKTQPRYEEWPDINEGMLCSGILDVGGKDACQGDSGGPLAHHGDIIVGVTSWGFNCADPFYPGIKINCYIHSSSVSCILNMRAIILLALLGSALAAPNNPSRIVGGSATTIQTYPYMSNMQFLWWGFFWAQTCGGSLLTPHSVLSAAHCFYGDEASQWRVVLGSTWASSGGSAHLVSRLVLHPQYDRATLDHDIAIVHLSNPAVYSSSVQPASIAGANYNLADGTAVTHIGWGAIWADGPASQQLMHVDVNIINQKLCADRYAYLKTQPNFENWPDITDNMLCAGILDVGGKDACQGDSGGPLAHNNNVIVGVISWGYECADPFYPGVNARVSRYTNWISDNAF